MRDRPARRCFRAAWTAAALLVLLVRGTPANAEPRVKVSEVCRGCLASVSATSAPAPLLVTLHGDWGAMAPDLHAAWERFAAPRGVALLSLTCPVNQGCKRSWWEWNGDSAWINQQVAALAARRSIDPERMWIAGWSGGAAYMGMRSQELERTFAALVMHGGGTRPLRAACAPEKAAIVFLAGDQNPLHARVLGLREHYEACGNDVLFTLLRGAEHAAEWKALEKHGGPILDHLLTKRRPAAAMSPPSAAVAATAASSSSASVVVNPAQPSVPAGQAPRLPPTAGCGCELARGCAEVRWAAASLVALVFALRRRSGRAQRR